ncbi:MAG: putative sporulation protein YtxC [Defluviitaleaceae bacterium]|nr:putative sporulation protein YtxC [Defluviitaleaceae bacterium]
MEIFVYTVEYEDLIRRTFARFGDDAGCAASALSIAACAVDSGLNFAEAKAVFADFLDENNHIYFDGFVRNCL